MYNLVWQSVMGRPGKCWILLVMKNQMLRPTAPAARRLSLGKTRRILIVADLSPCLSRGTYLPAMTYRTMLTVFAPAADPHQVGFFGAALGSDIQHIAVICFTRVVRRGVRANGPSL